MEKKITVKQDIDINIDANILCKHCKQKTKHRILSSISLDGIEEEIIILNNQEVHGGIEWYEKYQVVQCKGCENVAFRFTHVNSENINNNGYILHEDIYPNPKQDENNERNLIKGIEILPQNLQIIYQETIQALNLKQQILTAIGIRSIIETVCNEKNIEGNNLNKKINNLTTQGFLSTKQEDILHKLRILGNEAVHEVKVHDINRLELAIDIIEHLLKSIYMLPHYIKKTFH